jgi:hypothetical protein
MMHYRRSLRCVDEGKHLGIVEDGVSSVEGLMILQDQMLSAIYWQGQRAL